jgi:hypothetical protein
MSGSEKLESFNLLDHGDRHERERWPLVRDRFGNYEIFWRRYVVPLTNRVCGLPVPDDTSWIRVRNDIPPEWEKIAVCHYSVFYHLSRAAERRIEQTKLEPGKPTHPEDAISLLQTCCENVSDFYDALRAVNGAAVNYLPRQLPNAFPLFFRKIDVYRNLLIHNPVLGRGEKDGETLLPRLPDDPKGFDAWKNRFRFSWRAVEILDAENLISAQVLLKALEDELARYFDQAWARIIDSLKSRNLHESLKSVLKVPDFGEQITLSQPLTASGTFLK